MKYPIAQVVLTRRCNLCCAYCGWIKGVEQYPDRPFEDWEPYLDWLMDNSHHILLIGGEPTIHADFGQIVAHLASSGASFSVASNGAFTTKEDLQCWYDLGLYNWSVSVDTVTGGSSPALSLLKSNAGLRTIGWAREIGYTDIHANITLSRANVEGISGLVRELTGEGIWVSIGALSWGKGEGYDVWPERMEEFAVEQDDVLLRVCAELSEWAQADSLAHNSEPGHFGDLFKYAPKLSWRCDRPALIFDADCRLRLCRDIRGEAVPACEPLGMSSAELAVVWASDVRKYCRGCFWDCHWATCYWLARGGGEHFTHGQYAEGK